MENYEERTRKWILERLENCSYQVEELRYFCHEEIGKNYEDLYTVKLNFFGETVERIVFKHGQCLDMISKNIQVKDMLGKENNVIFPRNNGKQVALAERRPIMGGSNEISPDTVLFYEDYVSLREHFFEGNHCVQLTFWVRTDKFCSLDWGEYGRYLTTVNVMNRAV